MDAISRAIDARNRAGISAVNIGTVLDLLEANYGNRLYKDTNRENVLKLWASMFMKDDPREVLTAVKSYIETETFPPTVADIKRLMKRNRKQDKTLTHEERFALMDRDAEEYRKKYLTQSRDLTDRVNAFKAPITEAEMLMYKAKQKADEKFRMDRMRIRMRIK